MDARPDSAIAIAQAVGSGARGAPEAVDESLERITRAGRLGAFLTVDAEGARRAAGQVEADRQGGSPPGRLAGVPVAVKDNLCTKGLATTCASRLLEGHVPLYDAAVVARLRAAGAVVVGKTNLDEFAMGSSTEHSAFGPTRNPWDLDRVPGGSSGGSAAAVAAGLVPVALGSDTGGSVRQPAAFCGVYGLKPTYGRVSRHGLVAFASSLDQVGAFARDPGDLERLYRVVAGPDPRDATAAAREVEPVEVAAGVRGLRVGLAASLLRREGIAPAVAGAVTDAAAALARAGASMREVELPDREEGIAAYYLLANAEASSNLARYDGVRYGLRVGGRTLEEMVRNTRTRGFGAEVKRRILLGTYVLSAGYYEAFYLRAQRARELMRARFAEIFGDADLLLAPTTPTPAFRLGEKARDPLAMYLSDVFTVSANLVGGPALAAPWSFDGDGLPVGVQLLAAPWREDLLFRAAGVLETARRDPDRRPAPGGTS